MRIKKSLFVVVALALVSIGLLAGRTLKMLGNTNSPSTPSNTYSYTLEDIYQRLNSGAAGKETTFVEPTVGPGTGTMHTLNEVMGIAPEQDNTDGAITGNVLTSKTFWGLTGGQWGPQTGTMPMQWVENTTVNQPAGYYPAFNLSTVDTDLKPDNIRSTVSIYGVNGDPNVVNTSTGDATAADISSGKKAWVDGSEVIGTWDCPARFICPDFAPGTVVDRQSGLMWLQDANLPGNRKTWDEAVDYCTTLVFATYSDWRLPRVWELYSLIDRRHDTPALPAGHPFTGVTTECCWSSDTMPRFSASRYVVCMYRGSVLGAPTTSNEYAWPVRTYYSW